jgi:type II secretory pathway pseudopilin PulG|tara:strand:+ start:2057 stop:2626 length:570 start_codon:yes stop_codon:yes gene_type:complete
MAQERLDLRKEVFNKAQYLKTINTGFNELGITELNETLEVQITVEEFFGLYNSLFYNIPALGDINSHEYLVKTSGEYINFEDINEEIQALQAEIAQLRSDLLDAQMESVDMQASLSNSPESNSQLQTIKNKLKLSQQNLIEASTQTSNSSNNTSTNKSNINISSGGSTTGGASNSAASSGGSGGGGGGY